MKKPTLEVLQALCAIKSQYPKEYQLIETWLLDSSSDRDQELRTAEPPHILYKAQGGSKELRELCQIFATPHELAAKAAKANAGIVTPEL